MILNEKFSYGKDLVRLILAKFRLSFNDSQKQWFFGCNMNQLEDGLSHPTRVRGLKQMPIARHTRSQRHFAPHTGAWIETWSTANPVRLCSSHPTRVRGLKQG